jgi:poly(A) polymerase/tRNA nucleotidyltransferase (CCA-adding enzyme)
VSSINWKLPHPALAELLTAFSQNHTPVYVVGGAVRDLLMQREAVLTDLDLVLEGPAIPLARSVADRLGWAYYPLDETRDVARLVFAPPAAAPLVCDVAGMRGGSIEADLQLRDFTVNAMALAFTAAHTRPTLIDTVGGQRDLDRRLLRRVTPTSLEEDPLRGLRAVRLAGQLDFTIEQETTSQVRHLAANIHSVSPERVRDELWKLLETPRPHEGVERLKRIGLLPYLFPEVAATIGVEQTYPHLYPVYEHTLNALQNATHLRDWIMGENTQTENAAHAFVHAKLGIWQERLRNHLAAITGGGRRRAEWLIWFTLFHDVGKPLTRTLETDADGTLRTRFYDHEAIGAELTEQRLSALRFNRNEIELACATVAAHMRPHHLHVSFLGQPVSARAMFRFFRDVGGKHSGIGPGLDTLLVALADRLSVTQDIPPDNTGYIEHIDQLLNYAFDEGTRFPLPLVDGHTVMRGLDMKPGPQLGALLEYLMEAQAAGEIKTEDEALALAASWLAQEQG